MKNKTYTFEAETTKLLELLTHSIYSNKEIFLRELISNASDAIDKARIKSLTDTTYLWDNNIFEIKIEINKDEKTIKIEDNGIWMTQEEVIKNIWTIAKSWTKDFIEKLKESKSENNLIWQFWVWFYSAFMVSSKVQIETKSNDSDKSVIWISEWKWSFEIKEGNKKTRWTIITLFIKDEEKEFLEEWKIKELVRKYSNYISFPILLLEKEEKNWKIETKWSQINETKAIWNKDKSEIKDEEYNNFYSSITFDYNKPLTKLHLNTEWIISYKAILFIPQKANIFLAFDDPNRDYWPKLFVQNVMILEHAKNLLPVWLRFVSWVIQTSDLPLNISREMLQSNTTLDKIKKSLTKKILEKLKSELKENSSNYDEFLKNYWRILKEWIYYDHELKEQIREVIKFESLLLEKSITLDEYLEKAKTTKKDEKETKTIYYITAKSKKEAIANPYIDQFKDKNIDVLLLTDPIDEWIIQSLTEYKQNKLKSITDIKLEEENLKEEDKQKLEEQKKEFRDLFELIKNIIWKDKIEEVKISTRLWNNLRALSTKQWQLTPQMEKMMKAMWQQVPVQKRSLEVNINHKIFDLISKEFKNNVKSDKLQDMIKYLYEQAVILEWWELDDYRWFIERINKYIA